MRLFFYGTLIDSDVRRVVLGAAAAAALHLRRAVLRGWERRGLRDASYPVIVRRDGASVDGMLASGVGEEACRRLVAYEGDAYALAAVEVELADARRRAARVFVPAAGTSLALADAPWSYARWVSEAKRDCLRELGNDAPG